MIDVNTRNNKSFNQNLVGSSKETHQSICASCINATGGCCTRVKFTISEREIEPFRIAERKGLLPKGHSIELNDDDGHIRTYDYDSGEDKCIFLDNHNQCSIYDKRPLICKTYPVNWRLKKRKLTFYLDFECVLSHLKPVNSFFKEVNTDQVKDHCKDLGDMDFKSKDKRYVNLNKLYDEANPQFLLD